MFQLQYSYNYIHGLSQTQRPPRIRFIPLVSFRQMIFPLLDVARNLAFRKSESLIKKKMLMISQRWQRASKSFRFPFSSLDFGRLSKKTGQTTTFVPERKPGAFLGMQKIEVFNRQRDMIFIRIRTGLLEISFRNDSHHPKFCPSFWWGEEGGTKTELLINHRMCYNTPFTLDFPWYEWRCRI